VPERSLTVPAIVSLFARRRCHESVLTTLDGSVLTVKTTGGWALFAGVRRASKIDFMGMIRGNLNAEDEEAVAGAWPAASYSGITVFVSLLLWLVCACWSG
jgi:hypothetical protein